MSSHLSEDIMPCLLSQKIHVILDNLSGHFGQLSGNYD